MKAVFSKMFSGDVCSLKQLCTSNVHNENVIIYTFVIHILNYILWFCFLVLCRLSTWGSNKQG